MFSDFEKFCLSLTYDFVFKKIFGDSKYKRVLIRFLNNIIQCREKIINGEVMKTDIYSENTVDRRSRLDVLAKSVSGKLSNVYVQRKDKNNIVERSLFYWNRLFGFQLKGENGYKTFPMIVLIFRLFKTNDGFWRKCYIKDDANNTTELGCSKIISWR